MPTLRAHELVLAYERMEVIHGLDLTIPPGKVTTIVGANACGKSTLLRALAATGTSDLRHRPVDELSGGQRQRAWIALALAQDTPIMLLDEPTTYLDLAHQIEVLDLLEQLNERDGRTVVMVLHDLNQAARYADYIVALKEGAIYAEGPPAEVVTAKMVADVFGVVCQVMDDPVAGTPLCIPVRRSRPTPAAPHLDAASGLSAA